MSVGSVCDMCPTLLALLTLSILIVSGGAQTRPRRVAPPEEPSAPPANSEPTQRPEATYTWVDEEIPQESAQTTRRQTRRKASRRASRRSSRAAQRTTGRAAGTQGDDYYTNVDGERVHRPTFSRSKPAGASAQCRDGSYSFSRHRRGTCSHHGGVATWF